jgi:DNA-binding GntR family transcriptional regulator
MGLERLESLESLARRQGWTCGTKGVRVERSAATDPQAERLGIAAGDPVAIVSRIKTRDGKAFAEMISVLPESVATAAELRATFKDSITDLLAGSARRVRFARAEVTAAAAAGERARQLKVKAGQPLVVVDEVFVAEDGKPLAWNMLYFVPGALRLEVLRRISRPVLIGQ